METAAWLALAVDVEVSVEVAAGWAMGVLVMLGAGLEAVVSTAAGPGVLLGAGVLGTTVARGAGGSTGAGVAGAAAVGLAVLAEATPEPLLVLPEAFAGLFAAILLGAGAAGADLVTAAAGGAAAGTLASATFVAGSAAGALATTAGAGVFESVATGTEGAVCAVS